ncbi:MAG: hypothetical protein ACHREM_19880 [Polyangiales bacterium]
MRNIRLCVSAVGLVVLGGVGCGGDDSSALVGVPHDAATIADAGVQVVSDAGTSTADAAAAVPDAATVTTDAGMDSADAGAKGGDAADAGPPLSDTGSPSTISTGPADFCVVAPWLNTPQQFVSASGATTIPAGTFTLRYVGGAQSHDDLDEYAGGCGEKAGVSPTCFEVTAHYLIAGLQAGHHIYDGADPGSSTTSVWLDGTGTVGNLPDVASVEKANAGHTWPITLAGGPLYITFLDNDYGGNVGPGTQLCIDTTKH